MTIYRKQKNKRKITHKKTKKEEYCRGFKMQCILKEQVLQLSPEGNSLIATKIVQNHRLGDKHLKKDCAENLNLCANFIKCKSWSKLVVAVDRDI